MRYNLKILFALTTTIAIAVGSIAAWSFYYPYQATGTSVAVANRVLWDDLKLPSGASDITFYVDRYGCEAEFAISQPEFLEWCKVQGWSVSGITTPVPYFEPVCLPEDDRLVETGYEFSIPYGRVVYDSSRSRAAFWASTFP